MRPAIFLHIQKTAGTSVRRIAARNYGGSKVCGHGEFAQLGVEGCRKFDFISGHFGFSFAKEFMDDRYSFTFLRDPIERVVSLYTYLLTESPDQGPVAALAHKSDLKTFLAHGRDPKYAPALWNNQTWQLFHGWGAAAANGKGRISYAERFFKADADILAETVIENLKQFDYVGFKESFADDITTIFTELGAPEIDVHHSNPSKSSSALSDMDPDAWEFAKEITAIDQRVYDAAREMFPHPRKPRVAPKPAKGHGLRRIYNKIFRPN